MIAARHFFGMFFVFAIIFVWSSVVMDAQALRGMPALPGTKTVSPLAEARVPPLPEIEWTVEQRAVSELYSETGDLGNALSTMLRVPELAEVVYPFLKYTSYDSTLDPRHRELLILRVAWLAQNAYIWTDHAQAAQEAGLNGADIHRVALGPDADWDDTSEKLLLQFADELFRNSSVTDATWTTLSEQFDLYNMMDAVMTVAEFTTLSMLFNSLGVQPDSGATHRLPSDVRYSVVVPEREPPLTRPRIAPAEGDSLRVVRTIARHPEIFRTWGGNTSFVNRLSSLTPHDRELLILRIGWNCQAEYEWAKHVGTVGRARDHGLEPRWIAEGPESPRWEPWQVHLLTATDELYRDAVISDNTWKELSSLYNTHQMMSIVMTVGTYRFVSMALNAFGVQLLPDDERFPVF